MKSIARLKEQARVFEQKEEWEKAIQVYERALSEIDGPDGEAELGLFNRVGDLYLRLGRAADAVRYYEEAADRYAEVGLYNNAIALCNKALRNAPQRAEIYRKLGQLSAAQGFFTDARRWFLEYAERMLRAGKSEDAFGALEEFAEISADPEIREILAQHLLSHGEPREALRHLRQAYALRVRDGQQAAAEKLRAQILTIDPQADLSTIAVEEVRQPSLPDGFGDLGLGDLPGLDLETAAGSAGIEATEGAPQVTESLDIVPTVVETDPLAMAQIPVEPLEIEPTAIGGDEEVDPLDGLPLLDEPEPTAPAAAGSEAPSAMEGDEDWLADLEPTSLTDEFGEGDDFDLSSDGLDSLPLLDIGTDDLPQLDSAPALHPRPPISGGSAPEPTLGSLDLDTLLGDEPVADPTPKPVVPAMPTAPVAPPPVARPSVTPPPVMPASAAPEPVVPDPVVPERPVPGVPGAGAGSPATPPVSPQVPVQVEPPEAPQPVLPPLSAPVGPRPVPPPVPPVAPAPPAPPAQPAPPSPPAAPPRVRAEEDAPRPQQPPRTSQVVPPAASMARPVPKPPAPAPGRPAAPGPVASPPGSAQMPTPAARPASGSQPSPRGAGTGGGGFVDLGALLQDDQTEESNTRFVVKATAPTGDEEKDFWDMLAQFKAMVAEHVSADDSASHYDLGLAFKEMGLIDEAIAQFQIALRGDSVRLKVYEELGDCFVLKGQHNIAAKLLERAIEMPRDDDTELIGVYYQLGRCYEELNMFQEARDTYERVIALDINFRDVADRLAKL